MNRKKVLLVAVSMMAMLTISACTTKDSKGELDMGNNQSNQNISETDKGLDESIEPIFPAFTLNDIEGKEFSSDIFKENDINIVSIWQSTCEPCIDELEALNIIYKEYKDKGVNVIGISVDEVDITGDEGIKTVIGELKLDFPNVISNDRYSDELLNYVTGTPTAFIVGREGEFLMSPMAGSVGKEEAVERFRAIIESIQE